MTTLTYTNSLEVTSCGSCAIDFAMPGEKLTRHRCDGTEFWCPNGHRLTFKQTREQELREKLERAEKQLEYARTSRKSWQDQAETAERRRSAQVGVTTKLRKRVANGVCPCCNRSFVDLHKHMSGQHPEFASRESEAP